MKNILIDSLTNIKTKITLTKNQIRLKVGKNDKELLPKILDIILLLDSKIVSENTVRIRFNFPKENQSPFFIYVDSFDVKKKTIIDILKQNNYNCK